MRSLHKPTFFYQYVVSAEINPSKSRHTFTACMYTQMVLELLKGNTTSNHFKVVLTGIRVKINSNNRILMRYNQFRCLVTSKCVPLTL